MSGPMYGGPKVKRDPLRPVERRARILPGRQVEKVGNQLQREGAMWQKMLEDHEKDKQLLQANGRMGDMMKEWHTQWAPKFASLEGEGAVGSTVAATEALDKILKDNGEDLSPFASAHLERRWQGFSDSSLAGVASREAQQQALASKANQVEFGNGWIQAISHTPTIETAMRSVQEFSDMLVADLDEHEDIKDRPLKIAELRDYKDRAYSMLVGALIRNGDVKKAEVFLELYGTAPEPPPGEAGDPKQNAIIRPENKVKLDALLKAKKAELKDDSELLKEQAAADEIMAWVDEKDPPKSEVREKIRKKYKGEQRDRVTNRVLTRFNLRKDEEKAAEQEAVDAAILRVQEIVPSGPGPMTAAMEQQLHEVRKTIAPKYRDEFDAYTKRQLYNDPVTAATTAAADEYFDMGNDEIMSSTIEELSDRLRMRVNNDVWDIIKKEHRSLTRKPEGRSWKARSSAYVKEVLGVSNDADVKEQRVELSKQLQQAYEDAVAENEGKALSGAAQEEILAKFSEVGVVPGVASRWPVKEGWITKFGLGDREVPYWQAVLPGEEQTRAQWKTQPLESMLDQSPELREYIDEIYLPAFREANGREPTPSELFEEARWIVEGGHTSTRTGNVK